MQISDYIQLAGVITALFLGIVSIGITIYSQIQNNKMIEESTRPNISIYLTLLNVHTPKLYLVMKNTGNSPAKIQKLLSSNNLVDYTYDMNNPFEFIEGTTLFPNQKVFTALCELKFPKNITPIKFEITYSSVKTYSETFEINPQLYHKIILPRDATKDKELRTIANSLQNLNEMNL